MLDLKKIYAPVLKGGEHFDGRELQLFCPFHSHNHKTPSMSINTKTGNFICFSCGEKGGAVSFYSKTRNVTISQALKDLDEFDDDFKERPVQILPQLPSKPRQLEEHDYSDYILQILNESLLHDDRFAFYGKKLYELRGITYPTAVACCVGYDKSKGWVFPTFRYPDQKCIGYEVRKKDFTKFSNGTKCYRSKGGANCLSVTYSPVGGSRKAYVAEGAVDSIFLYQFLHEQRQKKYPNDILKQKVQDTILTPSNGVKILPNVVAELELWNDFDEIIFITDNDKWLPDKKTGVLRSPGNEAKAQLAAMEHGGKFKFYKLPEGFDYEDEYKKNNKERKKDLK